MTIYEVLMHVKLDLAEDTVEAAQRVIENKINEGEIYEQTAYIFSIRPVPREELPESAYPRKKKPGFCMVSQCRAEAYWFGPKGLSLCLAHYDMLKNPRSAISMGAACDGEIK